MYSVFFFIRKIYIFFLNFVSFSNRNYLDIFFRFIWWWIILNSNSIHIFFPFLLAISGDLFTHVFIFKWKGKVNFLKTWYFFELLRSWIEKESDLLISLEKRSIHCHFFCHEFIVLLKSHYVYIQHSNFESTWNHLINDLLVLLNIMYLLCVSSY